MSKIVNSKGESENTNKGISGAKNESRYTTLFSVTCKKFAILCLVIPITTLYTCLIYAMKYQFEEVNEDKCNVTNLLPSISAIMGVYPQCYAWRVVMALQCMPRFAVGFAYTSMWQQYLPNVQQSKKFIYTILYKSCSILYFIEICMGIGTAYISNKDNYPIHEKLFVIFLMACLAYQVFTIVLFRLIHPDLNKISQMERSSYRLKYICCALMCISVFTLLVSFIQHRFYCHPLAFSVFSGMEYIIATSNMVYHYSGVYDMPNMCFTVSGPMYDVTGNVKQVTEATRVHSGDHNVKKVQ